MGNFIPAILRILTSALTTFKGLAVLLLLGSLLAIIKGFIPIEPTSNISHINKELGSNYLKILNTFLIIPIVEEWIFRKFIPEIFQDIVGRKKIIIFSNLLFSFLHFDWFFLSYFMNGLIYSWAYAKTNDLKIPIIIHSIWNINVYLISINLL
ncbi:CPBP family intramembrane glutamic endopeptidase [Niallia sp. MER 6]|uniref:CPBP family intramembrane glutamic endopeptidase n=1 Tax=Niallia sp. MER 6 TaxID=2939567 RepID=UPI00203C2FAE|nr:CPBP family intramembrane glutamic endopeptidase [Niallia sp. MER 6]MCM3034163.1 CPBP family intramembrane metalloprotease [Niallia sp. MER 6]